MEVKIDGIAFVDNACKPKKVTGTLPLVGNHGFDNAVDTWVDCIAEVLVEQGYTVDEVLVERIMVDYVRRSASVTGGCYTKTIKTNKKSKKGRKR